MKFFFAIQEAFGVLGFQDDEKFGAYKLTAGVMMFGNMKYKQKAREEQAEVDSVDGKKMFFTVL